MFDHVVMIDYASTDRSIEIIKALAPHWEIRPSRNALFDACAVDAEVMSIETEFDEYWKTALNTTEFIVMPNLDLKGFLEKLEARQCYAIKCHGILLVDRIEDMNTPIDDTPLLFQRRWGTAETPGHGGSRHRLIHKHAHGHYSCGRHDSRVVPVLEWVPDELYCIWFGWAPYAHIKQRKLQIQYKMPADSILRGMGVEHGIHDEEHLECVFRQWNARAYDLYGDSSFRQVMESCKANYPTRS